jgi:hypothetical protein
MQCLNPQCSSLAAPIPRFKVYVPGPHTLQVEALVAPVDGMGVVSAHTRG